MGIDARYNSTIIKPLRWVSIISSYCKLLWSALFCCLFLYVYASSELPTSIILKENYSLLWKGLTVLYFSFSILIIKYIYLFFDFTFRNDTIKITKTKIYRNEISVPKELKEKFLYGKALRQEAFSNHTEYLKQKKIEEKLLSSSLMNDEIAQHILDIVKKLKLSMPHLHVIIKNGSYKVTKYIEKNPFDTLNNKNKNKNDKNDIEEQVTIQSQPKRATQKIHTVHTESPIVKLFQFFFSCVVHRGAIGKVKKEKIIMDGINLVLEQGKMYLVL